MVNCPIRCSKRMSVDRRTLRRWMNVETISQTLIISFLMIFVVNIRYRTKPVPRKSRSPKPSLPPNIHWRRALVIWNASVDVSIRYNILKDIDINERIAFAFDKIRVARSHTLLYNCVVEHAYPSMRMRGSWFHLTKSKFTVERIRGEL